jgi:serine/threonine protein kinase
LTQDFSSVVGGLAPGEQVAGYQVQEQIGRGGMAVVYRALDLRLGRPVALKVLAPHLGEDEAFRQRFIRESRAAAGVDHPHIVPVFEAGEADGVLFIAMRYVSYGDVRMLIDREGRLSTARAVTITAQVASALDAAHARGLVHRDVKPGNMLLAETGARGTDHVYLSDFGLSKHSLAASTLTSTGQFMGTLDYVSPEQIQGQPADGRADQYALACTTVEMLSGTPPFKRDESMALLWAQLESPPPRLTERRPDLPPAVDAVIRTALAKSPSDRYPTCLAFASALRAACDAGPVSGLLREPTAVVIPRQPDPQPPGTPREGDQRRAEPVPVTNAQRPRAAQPTPPRPATKQPVAAPVRPGRGEESARGAAMPVADRGAPGQHPPVLGTRQMPGSRAGAPPAPKRRKGSRVPAMLIALAVVAVLAVVGYKALHRSTPAPPPSASRTTGTTDTPAGDPARTVRDYFAAINRHRYRVAWVLVGDGVSGNSAGTSYQKFVAGYAGTARDKVTILSTSGNKVTARLAALQANGTVKTFQGTYTVVNGIITAANVQQTG